MLTRLGNEGKGRAKSMARLTGGGAGTVVAGGVRRLFSGRLDSADRLLASLRGRQMGYQDRSGTGQQENGAAEGSPAAQGSSVPTPEARRRGLGFWGGGGVEMSAGESSGPYL